MFLEDGEWNSADEYCEKVLDIDPECAEAYLGKLMVELKAKKQDDLKMQGMPFDYRNNFQKAMRFANDNLKAELQGYIDFIINRNLTKAYNEAVSVMNVATTEDNYKKAAAKFKDLSGFKDSEEKANICYEKAEIARKDAMYNSAISSMNEHTIPSYKKAVETFKKIEDWKDSSAKIYDCERSIYEIEQKEEAERIEAERLAEEKRIEAERIAEEKRIEAERLAEEKRIADERAAKKRKTIIAITTPIVCACIAFIIVLNTVIIPAGKYEDAIALMDAGNIDEAYSIFMELEDYRDAVDKAGNIRLTKTKEQLRDIKVGNYITFGVYEQDNIASNGKEDIEWLVLDVKDGKTLIISKYALDCKQYNTSYTDVTWETCTLRKWLNDDFINNAFSEEERAMIPTVTVSADKNPEYSTDPGNTTQDRVFLLSITEANKYFGFDSARVCEPTAYAVANGAYEGDSGNCWWWLRSPGFTQDDAAYVFDDGDVSEDGGNVDCGDGAVRPALWIDLNS